MAARATTFLSSVSSFLGYKDSNAAKPWERVYKSCALKKNDSLIHYVHPAGVGAELLAAWFQALAARVGLAYVM